MARATSGWCTWTHSGAPRPFLAEAYTESTPRISPDGRSIAYVTNRTGRFEVYVHPISDGPEVQVSVEGGVQPVWGPDGRELFYIERGVFMSARLAGGQRLAVLRRDSLYFRADFLTGRQFGDYDVFPDGREFLMLKPVDRVNPP